MYSLVTFVPYSYQLKFTIKSFCKFLKKSIKGGGKTGVAAWPDVPNKQTNAHGNLTPADRHGSVQVEFHHMKTSLYCLLSV